MMRFFIIILVISAVAIGALTCIYNYNLLPTQSVAILDSLKVGDTEEQVRQILVDYKIQEVERVAEGTAHKSYLMLSIENYKTSSCKGKLLLQFYNGGLYDVWFYPQYPIIYLSQLKKEGIDLSQNKEIYINNFRIWAMKDGMANFYVGRIDRTIEKQSDHNSD